MVSGISKARIKRMPLSKRVKRSFKMWGKQEKALSKSRMHAHKESGAMSDYYLRKANKYSSNAGLAKGIVGAGVGAGVIGAGVPIMVSGIRR